MLTSYHIVYVFSPLTIKISELIAVTRLFNNNNQFLLISLKKILMIKYIMYDATESIQSGFISYFHLSQRNNSVSFS